MRTQAAAASTIVVPSDAGERLIVTLIVFTAAFVASQLPLFGVHFLYKDSYRAPLGLLAVGLTGFISAFQLVEVVAAIIPPLNRRRIGNDAARAPLRTAAMGLGILFTIAQAWSMAGVLMSSGDYVDSARDAPSPLFMLALPPFILMALAWLVDRRGLGGGFAVVFCGVTLGSLFRALLIPLQEQTLGIGLPMLIIAAGIALAWQARVPAKRDRVPKWIPVPVSGVFPLTFAVSAMGLWSALSLPRLNTSELLYDGVLCFLLVDAALILGFLFFRPAAIRAIWKQWVPEVDGDAVQDAARRALPLALALAPTVLVVVTMLPSWLSSSFRLPQLIFTLVTFAVIADVMDEWRARRRLGPLVALRQLHRPADVEPSLLALELAGVEGHARGARYRSMLQLFGAYAPITLLVPSSKLEAARAVAER